jgi:hypothetical protein
MLEQHILSLNRGEKVDENAESTTGWKGLFALETTLQVAIFSLNEDYD